MLDKKCVIVAGSEGYIGNALVQRLLFEGYKVIALDNFSRDNNVKKLGSYSATKQINRIKKEKILNKLGGKYKFYKFDINKKYNHLKNIISYHRPSTIVNLAHQPSGPYSMMSRENSEFSLTNNILNTNNFLWAIKEVDPDIHYTTIGSTGEYQHDINVPIQEGYFTFESEGRISAESVFPRKPTSIYHASKISSFYLTEYLTRIWNLKTTEAEQAIVFGLYTKETDETKLYSRFDTDACFGTVLNKIIIQSLLGIPLTIFGEGKHKRGFISLQDSVNAIMLSIENPPENGKLRCFNQLSETKSINELAKIVQKEAKKQKNIDVDIKYINPSPRKEFTGEHYYKYITEILPSMGYKPTRTIEQEIRYVFEKIDIDHIQNLRQSIIENIKF